MTNGCLNSHGLGRLGGTKLDFHPRSYGQVRDGKQTHAAFAEIDAQGIHAPAIGEDAHAGVKPLSLGTPDDRKAAFEKHRDLAWITCSVVNEVTTYVSFQPT